MRVAGALVGVLAGCGTDQAPPAATLMAAEAPEAAVAERAPAASVAAAEAVAVATPSLSADAAQASRVMIDSLLDSARQVVGPPGIEDNEAIVNEIIAQTLQRLLADRGLLDALAR